MDKVSPVSVASSSGADKIVIIGGGHVGVSLLCDFNVRLRDGYERARLLYVRNDADRLSQWAADADFIFNDVFEGTSHRVRASTECIDGVLSRQAAEWLAAAKYIVITVPDIPYIRPLIFDHILDNVDMRDKVLVLCRAGQGGTPYIANRIRADSRLHETDIVMIEDSFYGTRVLGRNINCKRKYKVNVAIVSRDRARALKRIQSVFPPKLGSSLPSWPHFEVWPLTKLLFDPLGYIIHVGVALYDRNMKRTQRGESYAHYIDGIDRQLAVKLEELDAERVMIASAFGVQAETFPQTIARQYGKSLLPDFYEMMQSCRYIYKSRSAGSLDELIRSRYIGEDVPALFTMVRLAELASCPAPATHAHFKDVRVKLDSLGIDETRLATYAEAVPRNLGVDDLVELLNEPIPAALVAGQADSATHGVS
ncbi:MAG: NAD/NADP octopine/nopaline dehydrogenase family protein [Algiphilus sp.]